MRAGLSLTGRFSSPRSKTNVGAAGSLSIDPHQAGLGGVGLAGHPVGANRVRLEERAERVIVGLGDRVVLVVVALRAVEREAQERLGRVLDGVVQPDVAIELVPVADQEAGRAQRLGSSRVGLVGGEHRDDHSVVGQVAIERFDDPVAPPPDMRLALADLGDRSRPSRCTARRPSSAAPQRSPYCGLASRRSTSAS